MRLLVSFFPAPDISAGKNGRGAGCRLDCDEAEELSCQQYPRVKRNEKKIWHEEIRKRGKVRRGFCRKKERFRGFVPFPLSPLFPLSIRDGFSPPRHDSRTQDASFFPHPCGGGNSPVPPRRPNYSSVIFAGESVRCVFPCLDRVVNS